MEYLHICTYHCEMRETQEEFDQSGILFKETNVAFHIRLLTLY